MVLSPIYAYLKFENEEKLVNQFKYRIYRYRIKWISMPSGGHNENNIQFLSNDKDE